MYLEKSQNPSEIIFNSYKNRIGENIEKWKEF